jgi:uroporphyrinogen-III decarboxylase
MEAGTAAFAWIQACAAIDRWTTSNLGIPSFAGGYSKAPFDMVGDTLRGTRAIMLDLHRQPKKVLAAVERLVPVAIQCGLRSTKKARNPLIFMPLHKGADPFMSDKDFRTFYWPSLKATILGMVKQGLVPYLFVEGKYSNRLDVIADPDIPAGTTLWMFDQIDLREVKKRFAGWGCFGGNVPVSMMKAGTPEQIKTLVKGLIDDVGRDGGYILGTSAPMYDSNPENVRAFVETGKEYGAR